MESCVLLINHGQALPVLLVNPAPTLGHIPGRFVLGQIVLTLVVRQPPSLSQLHSFHNG